MEIKGEDYRVTWELGAANLVFRGLLRLRGKDEYAPIARLLDEALRVAPETLTLDLRDLRFMNSAGISMLLLFVLRMREQTSTQLVVRGAAHIPWQIKTFDHGKLSVFALDSQHSSLQCGACHKFDAQLQTIRFKPIAHRCQDCHGFGEERP